MADLEGKNSQCFIGETYDMVEVHRRDFFIWRRASGKIFNELNSFHSIIKFTGEYSK